MQNIIFALGLIIIGVSLFGIGFIYKMGRKLKPGFRTIMIPGIAGMILGLFLGLYVIFVVSKH